MENKKTQLQQWVYDFMNRVAAKKKVPLKVAKDTTQANIDALGQPLQQQDQQASNQTLTAEQVIDLMKFAQTAEPSGFSYGGNDYGWVVNPSTAPVADPWMLEYAKNLPAMKYRPTPKKKKQ